MSAYGELVGLQNQGAMCYVNSLVQVLFMIPEFRSVVFNWKYNKLKDGNENLCVALQLQKLFDLMDIAQQLCEPVKLDTESLLCAFGLDDKAIKEQQDICEFRMILFDVLELYFKNTPVEGSITKLFGGKITSTISSFESDYKSTKVEPFNSLNIQLPVGDNSVEYLLNDAIEDYFRENFLCGDDAFYDENIKTHVIASQNKSITEYPEYLTIELGRFACDNEIKNMLHVTIPFTLQMKSNIYEICAIVMHVGYTRSFGHYYTYIRNDSQTWFVFNDSEVTEVNEEHVRYSSEGKLIDDEVAYMILYKKIEID